MSRVPPAGLMLTVWQPYAAMLVWGVKPVENRTVTPWCPVGTRILIHAGLCYDRAGWDHARRVLGVLAETTGLDRFVRPPWPMSAAKPNPDADPLGCTPYGAIVGEVTLEEVRRAPRAGDPWWVGPVGWYVRRPVAIEPVFCKGHQGLRRGPDAEVELASRRVAEEVERRRAALANRAAAFRCPRCRAPSVATDELVLTCAADGRHFTLA